MKYFGNMSRQELEGSSAEPKPVLVGQVLGSLLRDPRKLLKQWNSKAAILSAIFRSIVFLTACVKSHHAGLSHAVLAEALFGALFAGLFGALTQSLRFAEPQWQAELLLVGAFPIVFQIGDFLFHTLLGTEVFHAGMIASAIATALSAAFQLYIMRRGTLLVGEGATTLAQDLAAIPKLIVLFVANGATRAWRIAVEIGKGFSGDSIPSS
jgi:hypothetical protein